MITIEQFIERNKPCDEVVIFLRQCKDLQEAWQTCPHATWMAEALGYKERPHGWGIRLALALMDAGVQTLVPVGAKEALVLVRRWCDEEVPISSLTEVRDAAHSAANALIPSTYPSDASDAFLYATGYAARAVAYASNAAAYGNVFATSSAEHALKAVLYAAHAALHAKLDVTDAIRQYVGDAWMEGLES